MKDVKKMTRKEIVDTLDEMFNSVMTEEEHRYYLELRNELRRRISKSYYRIK